MANRVFAGFAIGGGFACISNGNNAGIALVAASVAFMVIDLFHKKF